MLRGSERCVCLFWRPCSQKTAVSVSLSCRAQVFRALGDRAPGPDGTHILMVVGAGRGPLVKASLRAAARAQRRLRRAHRGDGRCCLRLDDNPSVEIGTGSSSDTVIPCICAIASRVYAVEKNVNAIRHLQCLSVSEKWDGVVTIVSHDMRTW